VDLIARKGIGIAVEQGTERLTGVGAVASARVREFFA
jgi:hypothetical protein